MKKIDSNRRNEKITGAFFIAATTTAIIGINLYGSVLKNTDFLSAANNASTQIALGAIFELLLACSNIGTGIMLYPHLKKYSESLGTGICLIPITGSCFYFNWSSKYAYYFEPQPRIGKRIRA